MNIETKYNLGDTVCLITDKDKLERIVTEITICPTGILYALGQASATSKHYDFEIEEIKKAVKVDGFVKPVIRISTNTFSDNKGLGVL